MTESETPETDMLMDSLVDTPEKIAAKKKGALPQLKAAFTQLWLVVFKVGMHARSLERRLAQAQTEIDRLNRIVFEPLGDNHHNAWACPYCNPHIEKQQGKLALAQARVAELEKVAKFLLGEEALLGFWFGERPEGQPIFWWRKHLREALKVRA